MTTLTATPTIPREDPGTARRTRRQVAGVVLSALVSAFLAFDSVTHLLLVDPVREANEKFGAPEWFPQVCGVLLAVCLVTHLVPRTAVLGAVLLTGYLGGAVCANLMTEQPAVNTGFAVLPGVLVCAGLWLRDERVRLLYG